MNQCLTNTLLQPEYSKMFRINPGIVSIRLGVTRRWRFPLLVSPSVVPSRVFYCNIRKARCLSHTPFSLCKAAVVCSVSCALCIHFLSPFLSCVIPEISDHDNQVPPSVVLSINSRTPHSCTYYLHHTQLSERCQQFTHLTREPRWPVPRKRFRLISAVPRVSRRFSELILDLRVPWRCTFTVLSLECQNCN